MKQHSRRIPDWVLGTKTFKKDIYRFLEVDFFTLSSVILYSPIFYNELNLFEKDIQKFILKLQSYGCGVIVTDHQVQNLFEIVDRAMVIGEQTIIASGKPKDILKSEKAREIYFGSYEN